MDWTRWQRILGLLDAHNVKPIIGVIPDNKDPTLYIDPPREDFWDVVSQWHQKGWTVGFHGYQHLYVTQYGGIVPINRKSEFAGLPLEFQEAKIRRGWRIFQSHGLAPAVWIAPGHSFDKKTLLALKSETDVKIISDGIALNCFMSDGFYWIPQQLWRYRKMPFGVYTICFHPNSMSEQAFRTLEGDLDKYAHFFLSFSDIKFSARPKNGFEKILTELFIWRAHTLRAIFESRWFDLFVRIRGQRGLGNW